jgi:hypothetical protein
MKVWVSLNQQTFHVTNRNRKRMRAVLGQRLKEISVLDPSDFELIPLDITGLLRPAIPSISPHEGILNLVDQILSIWV